MALYPQRDKFFAYRYCRLLAKTCAAQDIGHISFALCVTIAHIEDAKRYTGPVTFYNDQLCSVVGVTKWKSLDNARKRASEHGWLHYEPGKQGCRQPGRYWVTVPSGYDCLDDSPCDEEQYASDGYREGEREGDRGGERSVEQPAPKGEREGERSGYREGDRGGELSTLTLSPNPSPKKEAAKAADIPAELTELIDGWNNLSSGVVIPGNGARVSPPSKVVMAGWNRSQKNPELRAAVADVPAMMAAISKASFCHGQGWFTLPWLFGKNKHGELNAASLLAGRYDGGSLSPQSEKERRTLDAAASWLERKKSNAR